MKQTTNLFIYVLYALLACVVFIYLLFPSETVKEILTEQLAQIQPGIEIQTETIRPTIPPGLGFKPLTLMAEGKPIVHSEKVKVRPHLLSLLRDTKVISFNGPLGSGRMAGRAELEQTLKRSQQMVHIDLTAVPLESIPLFKKWPNYRPSGAMNGMITYDSLKGGKGRVDAEISVEPIRIVFDPPIMGLDEIAFTELQGEFSATHRQITINRCEAFGEQVEARISGFIALREPLGASRPTLSLTVKPQPAFIAEHKNDMIGGLLSSSKAVKRGVVFQISGTLDNPSYVIR